MKPSTRSRTRDGVPGMTFAIGLTLSLQPAQYASTPLRRHRHGGSAPEADDARAPLHGPMRLQLLPAAMELPYVLQHYRRARYSHGLQGDKPGQHLRYT